MNVLQEAWTIHARRYPLVLLVSTMNEGENIRRQRFQIPSFTGNCFVVLPDPVLSPYQTPGKPMPG
jgi:hypothetical protein